MWKSVRAWVLTHRAYGDKGMILHCLTDEWGRQSFFLPSIRSRNAAIRPSMLLPLTPLAIVARNRGTDKLERIKEASMLWHPQNMHTHPIKSAVTLYLAELIFQLFSEANEQIALWNLLEEKLKEYDNSSDDDLNFPLWLSLKLLHYSGLALPLQSDPEDLFDLQEGVWIASEKDSSFDKEASSLLAELLILDWKEASKVQSSNKSRRALMEGLGRFYEWHIPDMRPLRSIEIVREYLSGI
jgi:DNA repair protein RecO (recombination protein O)